MGNCSARSVERIRPRSEYEKAQDDTAARIRAEIAAHKQQIEMLEKKLSRILNPLRIQKSRQELSQSEREGLALIRMQNVNKRPVTRRRANLTPSKQSEADMIMCQMLRKAFAKVFSV